MSNFQNTNLLMVYVGYTTTADIMKRFMLMYANETYVNIRSIEGLEVRKEDIEWSDIVLIVRGADYFLFKIMEAAKKAKRLCIFYIDDDLLTLYDNKSEQFVCLTNCLKLADILWTSNKNIKEKYSQFIPKSAKAVETVILDPWDRLVPYQPEKDTIGIVFAGSPSHYPLINKYIIPALKHLYEQYQDIRVYFIGFSGTKLDGAAPFISTTPWFDDPEQYRDYVASQNIQIGLAIIEDSFFGSCKFYNKYIEYTKLGILGVYSKCEPFTFAIKNEWNGILVEYDIKAWSDALLKLIQNKSLREACIKNAQKDLLEHYGMKYIIGTVRDTLPEMEKYKASKEIVNYRSRLIFHLWRLKKYLLILLHPTKIIERIYKGRK